MNQAKDIILLEILNEEENMIEILVCEDMTMMTYIPTFEKSRRLTGIHFPGKSFVGVLLTRLCKDISIIKHATLNSRYS